MLSLLLSGWFGILASISPCPLTTNIAIISFISKKISSPKKVIISGIFYTVGRMILYVMLGFLLKMGLSSIPQISNILQKYTHYLIGPILVLIGSILSGIIDFKISSNTLINLINAKLGDKTYLNSFLFGVVFASAFCATSAALFFGNILNGRGNLIHLSIYGMATGLPTIFISFIIAFSVNNIGNIYNKIILFEKYFRKITAVIFLVSGTYYSFRIFI